MSTPDERMRSLRWAWELLDVIQTGALLPRQVVERAAAVASRFPSPAQLVTLLAEVTPTLPPDLGTTIDEGRALFEEIQFGGFGSEATRRSVLYTLRHYPLSGAFHWADSACAGQPLGLSTWLKPEEG